MARERKKIVVDDAPETLDLSGFSPDTDDKADHVSADAVKAVSEQSGFGSREPKAAASTTPARRRRSPYTAQIGARVRPETKERFQEIAARLDISDAQALDDALILWLEEKGAV